MIPVGGASILKGGHLLRRVAVCLIHDSLQNFHLAILLKTPSVYLLTGLF